MKRIALALTIFLMTGWCQSQIFQKTGPDAVYINGNVYTGAPGKAARAEAFAVTAGKIVAVGNTAAIRKLAAKTTQVHDLQGAFVMPGFNDAHVHLSNGGFEKLNVDLIGTRSLEEMQRRIAERVKTAAPGEWITGRGWDQTKWTEQVLPTRADLDKVTGDHPALFTRVDGHILVANTAALKAAGVTKETEAPEGGKIDREAQGEATGIIRETAMGIVLRKVPAATKEQRRRAVELALKEAAQWGITSAQDNSSWEDFLVYEELQRQNKLTLRITEWLWFDESVENLKKARVHHTKLDSWLSTGMLKGVMDGSLGSSTAALLAPYADDARNSGLPRYTQEQLNKMVAERVAADFQIGFHAIGDLGVDLALKAFEYGARQAKKEPRELRMRVEHNQVMAPDQFARFKELGVIASVQPNHLLTDMNWAEARIGKERAKISYPWALFSQHGVRMAFGTDYPVEPISPFRGLYAAVTRKNEVGNKSYYPEQALTIDQAIAAYTRGSAYAEFAETEKGTIAKGMFADFVVLDRDITNVRPEDILMTRVLRTVVGGKTVYEAGHRE
jgi:predicted amidohydrolase YtcJ